MASALARRLPATLSSSSGSSGLPPGKSFFPGQHHTNREAALLRVGLTGGIASGKSVVGEMFRRRGAHLIQADVIAHQLLEPGQAVYDEVIRCFGPGIVNPDGTINRAQLAQAAFGGPASASRIKELNHIVHPAVLERQQEWIEEVAREDRQGIAMVEAALILEAGAGKDFDRLVVVTCRPEQRTVRWAKRQNVDGETARQEVERRMAAQWSDEEKIKAADYVIDNSGSLAATEQQVDEVMQKLRKDR